MMSPREGIAANMLLAVCVLLLLLTLGIGEATATVTPLSAITTALTEADSEVRTSTFPAVSSILGAVVLISIAGTVVAVLSRRS